MAATKIVIDGQTAQALSAGQTTQIGGTQGPNAIHGSTGSAGEFIGANFNYLAVTTLATNGSAVDISAATGLDADGELQALPRLIATVQERATVVVVNATSTKVFMIIEGPHGWGKVANDLRDAIRDLGSVDNKDLAGSTIALADALALA